MSVHNTRIVATHNIILPTGFKKKATFAPSPTFLDIDKALDILKNWDHLRTYQSSNSSSLHTYNTYLS